MGGVEVEVHLRFDGRWVTGFEMAGTTGSGDDRQVWIRRRSDGTVLPDPFPSVDVREVWHPSRRRFAR